MDLGDIVAATLAVSICGLLLWVCMGPALFRPFENYVIRKFHRFLASLESHNQDYTYYTTGHLVWSATSIEEIERDIKKLCICAIQSSFAATSQIYTRSPRVIKASLLRAHLRP